MKYILTILCVITPLFSYASPNTQIDSFSKAKRLLMSEVYSSGDTRNTVYCNASFDADKQVSLPSGFDDDLYTKRSKRVEFEHIVPAENFGRSFKAWRDGDAKCVSKGKAYKGRKCATKVSEEFRLMQADGHNLYAAIGSVNAYRSNYNFQMLSGTKSKFGSCDFHVDNRKAQPPEQARGLIARTYLYFEATYPSFKLSRQQKQLFTAWDKMHPVTKFECEKAKMVEKYQGNPDKILAQRCSS